MSGDWYYAKDGKRFGPFTFEQFRQMAASGLLGPQDMVQDESAKRWLSAQSVAELFAPVGPPQLPPPPEPETPTSPATPQRGPAPAEPVVRGSRPAPSGKGWHPVLGLLLLGVMLWLLKAGGCLPEDFSTLFDRNAGARLAKEVTEADAIPISAQALTQEWRSNDIAADTKYKGKVLEVSGTVAVVRGGSSGPFGSRPFVQLAGIRCECKTNDQIQHLSAGRYVTVRGKYQGGGVLAFCVLRP